jgi:hypothetical protein
MRPFSVSYLRGEDRGQETLLPAAIEDYIAAAAPVRVIDAFVDGFEVRGFKFGPSVTAEMGVMLAVWLMPPWANHPFHVPGQHLQRHFGADVPERFYLIVRRTYPPL